MTYTTEQLSEMSSSQLVNLYNELTGGTVSRFATKDAGIRRILKAQEELVEASDAGVEPVHEVEVVEIPEVIAVDDVTVGEDIPQKYFPLTDDGSRTRAYVELCDRIKTEQSSIQWKVWKAEVYNVRNNLMALEGETVTFTVAPEYSQKPVVATDPLIAIAIKATAEVAPATAKATGKRDAYDQSHIVTLLVAENPKRQGSASHERFAKYRTGMTVADALSAGVTREDINWDVKHGFIAVGEKPTASE